MPLSEVAKVEALHYGDKRLDSLAARIEMVILETQEAQQIPTESIVGILERIKINLVDSTLEL
jgi:hypothetical protein